MNSPVTDLNPTSEQFKVVPTKFTQKSDETIVGRFWDSKDYHLVTIMVHGLGAHSGWFEPLASRLAMDKVKTYSFDLAGFGEGKSRKVDSWKTWIEDLVEVYNYVIEAESGKPLVLIGNSMGALIVLSALKQLKSKPGAIALFSPGFGGYAKTFTLGYKVKAIAAALLTPGKIINLPYTVEDITSNKEIQKAVSKDQNASFSIPARLGLELLKLTNHAIKDSTEIEFPMFLAMAGKDIIVDNKLIDDFYNQVNCPQKHKELLSGSYHDLVFEDSVSELISSFNEFIATNKILNQDKE